VRTRHSLAEVSWKSLRRKISTGRKISTKAGLQYKKLGQSAVDVDGRFLRANGSPTGGMAGLPTQARQGVGAITCLVTARVPWRISSPPTGNRLGVWAVAETAGSLAIAATQGGPLAPDCLCNFGQIKSPRGGYFLVLTTVMGFTRAEESDRGSRTRRRGVFAATQTACVINSNSSVWIGGPRFASQARRLSGKCSARSPRPRKKRRHSHPADAWHRSSCSFDTFAIIAFSRPRARTVLRPGGWVTHHRLGIESKRAGVEFYPDDGGLNAPRYAVWPSRPDHATLRQSGGKICSMLDNHVKIVDLDRRFANLDRGAQ
jgi:hypothetical protein